MKTKKVYWVAFMVVAGLTLAITAYFVLRPEASAPKKLTIAVTRAPDSALVYIAHNRGYFREEGLEVTLQPFEFGKVALDTMLEGKADLATVAETPIMLAVMRGKPLEIISGIFSSDRNMGIVARRDKGISAPGDLAGKRIGTALGTNGDYFRYAFLATHGVRITTDEMVALPPKEMVDALEAGRVDAVSAWNPWLFLSKKKLGSAGITFYGESIYTYTFNVTASKQLVTNDRDAVEAFLRALKKAERFALENPAQSLEIVANATGLDREMLKELWDHFTLRLSLEQTLLISMENQARWAIGEQIVGRREIPNFMEFIYFDGLKVVSPGAVSIIH